MKWYIVRVESRRAATVAENLGGLYPCWMRWTKPSGKRTAVMSAVPCFPGWVFLPMSGYGREMEELGVLGVMKYGRMGPLLLDERDMDRVREIASVKEEKMVPMEKRAKPAVGDVIDVGWGLSGTVLSVGPAYATVDVGGSLPLHWHY